MIYRYCSGGNQRRRDRLDEDFGASDVECPICGRLDNHASNRRGLCAWCYCALANEIGETEFHALDQQTLERRARQAALKARAAGRMPYRLFLGENPTPKPEPPKPVEPQPAPKVSAAREASLARLAKYGEGGFACDKAAKKTEDLRLYMAEYRRTHREQVRATWRKWYYAHRERYLAARRGEYYRAYYAAHIDARRAYMAEYRRGKMRCRSRSGDARRAYMAEYRATHRARMREYRHRYWLRTGK